MERPTRLGISRRALTLCGAALPWAAGSRVTHAISPVWPMGEREMRELLRIYDTARKTISGPLDEAAIATRDQAAARFIRHTGSGPSFGNWPATIRLVKPVESGRRLGLAVDLAEGIGLQTYLGDELDMTWTSISKESHLADILRYSDGRLRVWGQLKMTKWERDRESVPIDMLAGSSNAGAEVSLLARFTSFKMAS